MILTFRHKGLEQFYKTGSKAGIQAAHSAKIRRILARLDSSSTPNDMNIAGWNLHPLSGNWRITFRIESGHAEIVDYQDYH